MADIRPRILPGLTPTRHFDEFLEYYRRASRLERYGNLGGVPYQEITDVDDPLMQSVTIYDCIHRRHAGFSNIPQDLWWGRQAPKYYKWNPGHQQRCVNYNHLRSTWTMETWLFVFLVHRVTGSGASFESDHGYRNSIVPKLAEHTGIEGMVGSILLRKGPMFTSIGNQPPALPKPVSDTYKTNADYYFSEFAPRLVVDLAEYLTSGGTSKTIREVWNWMGAWNKTNGLRFYKFVYAAFVADLADYFPQYVDPASQFIHGKNAEESCRLMFKTSLSRDDFLDRALSSLAASVEGFEYDVEDVCCDYIRYIENYVPLGRGTYAHIDLDKVFNNPRHVKLHLKGRQFHHLQSGIVSTHNGPRSFGDYSVLDRGGIKHISEYTDLLASRGLLPQDADVR